MSEARLVAAETGGLVPESDGWFVLNAKDTRWLDGDLGAYCKIESKEVRFRQVGINLNVLQPGMPMTMYHRENAQEDFLVLAVGARTGEEDDGSRLSRRSGRAEARRRGPSKTSLPAEAYGTENAWGAYREAVRRLGRLPGS